jgi:hypothetical protein
MPANLPPQYFAAEKVFRAAKTSLEKIAALEEMLAIMPKHKGTDHLRAELRSRIAKLTQLAGKKTATQRASMDIEKEGAAQVAVVGVPNSGKSQLVSILTKASPTVAEYPFTTHSITPGMMPFENVKIQLLDTPPLAPNAIDFWLPHVLRRTDILLIMADLSHSPVEQVEEAIAELKNMRISIDAASAEEEGILSHQKALIVGNKLDLDSGQVNYTALQNRYGQEFPLIAVSAAHGAGLEDLKLRIFQVLDIIRVYTKTPGQKPDLADPIILERGSTVADAAASVHKDFVARLRYARIWGSGKHDGIMAKRNHVLQDGDIIELHLRK